MIELVIDFIAERLTPAYGDNLVGFRIDLEHYVAACDSLHDVRIEPSGTPKAQIVVRAEFEENVLSLQDINGALGPVWRQVAYQHFEASACRWYREATVFRFATVPSNDDYFVAGSVIITGPRYPQLVEQFE